MTSVFGGLFIDNIRRLETCSRTKSAGSTPTEKSGGAPGKEFARVLADLEEKPETVSKSSELSSGELVRGDQNKTSTEGFLTNIGRQKSEKSEYQRGMLTFPEKRENAPPQSLPQIPQITSARVKRPADGVNALPPPPVLPEAKLGLEESIPRAPSVVSASKTAAFGSPRTAKAGGHFAIDDIKNIVVTAGRFHGVDPALSLAVAQAESSYDRHAVSNDGHYSKGVFQLLDSTGKDMMSYTGIEGEQYDPFDPGQNAFLGVGYLRRLMNIFSEETKLNSTKTTSPAKSSQELEKLAVAAFNAGEGTVVYAQQRALAAGDNPGEYQAIEKYLPAITRSYVRKVSEYKQGLVKDFSGFSRV